MIVELKGSSVKERHWKQLMKQLHVIWTLSDLTLGQVQIFYCWLSIFLFSTLWSYYLCI